MGNHKNKWLVYQLTGGEDLIAPYFKEEELDCLHDTVYDSIGVSIKHGGELANLVHTAPDNIKEIAYEFGLCDTVFRDMMFVWLRQNRE